MNDNFERACSEQAKEFFTVALKFFTRLDIPEECGPSNLYAFRGETTYITSAIIHRCTTNCYYLGLLTARSAVGLVHWRSQTRQQCLFV